MGRGKKSQVTGYRYYFGIHMGIGRGPVDQLNEIRVGGKQAWSGLVNANTTINIDAYNLFGGEDKEGGVQGTLDVMLGGPTQVASAGLTGMLGGPLSGFRRMFTVFYDGIVSMNNPYPKPWKFRFSRILSGWDGPVFQPNLAIVATTVSEDSEFVTVRPLIVMPLTEPGYVNSGAAPATTLTNGIDPLTSFSEFGVELSNFEALTLDSGDFLGIGGFSEGYGAYVPYTSLSAAEYSFEISRWELENQSPDIEDIIVLHGGSFGLTGGLSFEVSLSFGFIGTFHQFYVQVSRTDASGTVVVEEPLNTPSTLQIRVRLDVRTRVLSVFSGDTLVLSVPYTGSNKIDEFPNGLRFLVGRTPGTPLAQNKFRHYVRNVSFSVTETPSFRTMNPAHIIYECLTNREWGRGLNRNKLDDTSFEVAARALFAEGFGLCLRWTRKDSIQNFVQLVLDHIGATLYQSRATGLMTLKLIRGDYVEEALPILNMENGLLEIRDLSVGSSGSSVNAITVTWHDPISDTDRTVSVKNTAAILRNGGAVKASSNSYIGIPDVNLALRVAQRDLRASSTNLRRFTLVVDRSVGIINPGDVLRIEDRTRGIPPMVVRVGKVRNGSLLDGRTTLEVVQDVFGLPATAFAGQVPDITVPVDTRPCTDEQRAFEVPYFLLAQRLSAADLDYVRDDGGYVGAMASKGKAINAGVKMATRDSAPTPDDTPPDDSYICSI